MGSPRSIAQELIFALDEGVVSAQRGWRRLLKRERHHRITPYRGWAAPGKAVVIGRVIEDDARWGAPADRAASREHLAPEEQPSKKRTTGWRSCGASALR